MDEWRRQFQEALFGTVVISVLVRVLVVSAAHAATATDVRAWAHPTYTRLVIELTEPVKFSVFALPSPHRLVMDFSDTAVAIRSQPLPDDGVGVIGSVRYGQFKPEVARVVLDLLQPVHVDRAFLLSPEANSPTRFVVDLSPSNAEAFTEYARLSQRSAGQFSSEAALLQIPARIPVIVIDAGHGGVDPGAVGISGTQEKSVALEAARQLAERLTATGRYQAVLTRERDVYVGLRDRVALARQAEADLFLSIHADSIEDSRLRGSHVYSLSQTASDSEAEALAAKENKSDIIAGLDLGNYSDEVNTILLDLSQRETNNMSVQFAEITVDAFVRHGVRSIRRPHRQAGFAVLKAPDVPSLLIELGFLSNRHDERILQTRAGRKPIIDAIMDAVDSYFAATLQ